MTKDEVKQAVVSLLEIRQGYLGVDLRRDLEKELADKIDFPLPEVFDELVQAREVEKAQFLVPQAPDGWQVKTVYFPAGTQFWNTTTKFVTPD